MSKVPEMNQQHTDAIALIRAIGVRIGAGNSAPIVGYKAAAELIGRDGSSEARYVGQVCSLCDAAAFVAGWPMLTVHYVRKPDGKINEASFAGWWEQWRQSVVEKSTTHHWQKEHLDDLVRAISSGLVPNRAAASIWEYFQSRGEGFVEFNLHRKLRT
jgi:hypothetical protein